MILEHLLVVVLASLTFCFVQAEKVCSYCWQNLKFGLSVFELSLNCTAKKSNSPRVGERPFQLNKLAKTASVVQRMQIEVESENFI